MFDELDAESFEYRVVRSRRKTMALHVLDDGSVELRAPHRVAAGQLARFVEKHSAWVVQQRRQRLQQRAELPGFGAGALHPFLGQHYPLNIRSGARYFDGEAIHLGLRSGADSEQIKRALLSFYREQALARFPERVEQRFESLPWAELSAKPKPQLKLRKMRARWGSLSSRGAMTLNTLLVALPEPCIDYVIAHELCHLWEFNHSRAFYGLLQRICPEWRAREAEIEKLSPKLAVYR